MDTTDCLLHNYDPRPHSLGCTQSEDENNSEECRSRAHSSTRIDPRGPKMIKVIYLLCHPDCRWLSINFVAKPFRQARIRHTGL